MASTDLPLSVAVAAVIHKGKILLFKRKRGDYVGLYSLPGGKIHSDEHVSQAALREIHEETGLACKFESYLGLVSEHLLESGASTKHFLLNLCLLTPATEVAKDTEEGESKWFDLSTLQNCKDLIIPSDYLMIEKMVKDKTKSYFECKVTKTGNNHKLDFFK